jgi:putative solute:sodium symporter small subunit
MHKAENKSRGPDLHDKRVQQILQRYWRLNLLLMTVLLFLWAGVSLGCGVLIADWLNQFRVPLTGFPLGFWFAQQGSIVVFVLCILIYCVVMNALDRHHHRELEKLKKGK